MATKRAVQIFLGVLFSLLFIAALFSPVLALIGDTNLDDLVNASDLSAISQLLGTTQTNSSFDRFKDLNLDNDIDVKDLAIAGRSYGSTRNFHYPRRVSNSGSPIIYLGACMDASDRVHIAWSEANRVYYTRLDRFGNTLIDDVLLEAGGFAGNSGLAIGCDNQGNSHLIWDCADSQHGTCQARIDQFGYFLFRNRLDTRYPPAAWPAVDLNSSGQAHLFYTKQIVGKTYYTLVDPGGEAQISQQIIPQARRYHELIVDQKDQVHLLYPVYTDTHRLAYQRIGAGTASSLAMRTIGVLGWEGGYNDSIRPSLAVDANNNVFATYITFSTIPSNLYIEKIDASGNSVVDDRLVPDFDITSYGGAQTDMALDSKGNPHLVTFTDFSNGSGVDHTAYGVFDNNVQILHPLRWIIYDEPIRDATLLEDSQDEAQLIYKAGSPSGYPPCADSTLCYQGTSFEANTYNLNLPDLGSDVSHLSWGPFLARWNTPLVITGTVFNAGWYTSTAGIVRVSLALTTADDAPLDSIDVAIPALGPYQSQAFIAHLDLPFSPPPGFASLKFIRLRIDVDPAHSINETTESNNHISAPIPVEPLPTQTRLYLVVRDDTLTAAGGAEATEYINTGKATIVGPGYPEKQVDITDYTTILGNDFPVPETVVTYTIHWSGTNYQTPNPVKLGLKRNAVDLYKIDFTPLNTAVMVTNRWASLGGTITKSDGGGGGLTGAKVRLEGQGVSLEVTTDASGNYSPAGLAALGKLIPGAYQVRISRANYARLMDTLIITGLEARIYDRVMDPTVYAYLHGNLINEFGNPVPGAQVHACGAAATTDTQGIFDLQAAASCTNLTISQAGYASFSQSISLTAGLETLLADTTLAFDPPVKIAGNGDRVASRIIDQTTGGMLPDAPSDAGFALTRLYEKFKDEFWIDYRIMVLYGCYEYHISAAYTGAPGSYQLRFAQVNLAPKTFEVHMSLASVDFLGATIPIPLVSDSGMSTALNVIEMRLVNTDTGQVIKAVRNPLEGGGPWIAFDEATRTYDFSGASFESTGNTEIWLYLKAGKNTSGNFTGSPLLYQFDQQILKLNLSTGEVSGSYQLGNFPLP